MGLDNGHPRGAVPCCTTIVQRDTEEQRDKERDRKNGANKLVSSFKRALIPKKKIVIIIIIIIVAKKTSSLIKTLER